MSSQGRSEGEASRSKSTPKGNVLREEGKGGVRGTHPLALDTMAMHKEDAEATRLHLPF